MALNEGNKDKKSRMYLFIMIFLLFLINLGLIYKLVTKNNELKTTTTELQSTEAELKEVETLKMELEADLEEYRGKNESLDSIITARDSEIQSKLTRIQTLLKSGNITKAERDRARAQIRDLKKEKDELTAEIDRLSKENQYLKDENYVIQKQVEAEREKVAEMETVISERDEQVSIGSRIFMKSFTAKPLRNAVFGEYKVTDKLNRTDKIEITYTLANNDLAAKGEKTLYFQIVTPNKSTLTNADAGSGTFNYDSGERYYTAKKVVNFQNTNEKGSFSIPKTEGMTAGRYVVNVYSETHKMDASEFTLK
jgi:cell division protein FtsB